MHIIKEKKRGVVHSTVEWRTDGETLQEKRQRNSHAKLATANL